MIYKQDETASIILEIKELVNGIESAKNQVDIYCDLMKQMMLSASNAN